jgi:hypothetical protein
MHMVLDQKYFTSLAWQGLHILAEEKEKWGNPTP